MRSYADVVNFATQPRSTTQAKEGKQGSADDVLFFSDRQAQK
jgi:hypothetical protein